MNFFARRHSVQRIKSEKTNIFVRSNADGFDSMAEKVSNFDVVKMIEYARQKYLCK